MNRWFNFKITQQFLLFFLFTSILPIGVISLLFFQSIDSKFSERITRMLAIGALFAEEVYQDDLEKLAVSTNQAASFSLYRDFQTYLKGRSLPALKTAMDRYIKLRSLDVLIVYGSNRDVIAQSGDFHDLSPASYQAILKQAYRGNTVITVENYGHPNGEVRLEYVSASPVFSNDGKHQVIGILLAAQSLAHSGSFSQLGKMLPELDFRIYVREGASKRHHQLYSTLRAGKIPIEEDVVRRIEEFTPRQLVAGDVQGNVFKEKIQGESYKSKALVLKNYLQEPIGFFVVSSSESDLLDLKLRNISYITIYLLFGLSVVGLMGIWFKRSFVDPMRDLAHASEQVGEGKLDCQIEAHTGGQEIDRTIASFNKMLAQLKEDERLRSTFVSTLTHDLRTPLIAQKRVLEMYEEYAEEFPKEFENLNQGLLKNNDHLLEMVNKLLEAYQYEAGKIVLVKSSFSLYGLVTECFEETLPLAAPKNIELRNQVPKDLPLLHADKDQLKRVLQNLVSNAISNIQESRYVEVRARVENGNFRIEVSDNGPGINPDTLPHLFTRYFTGDRLRQKIGSGLGLYICRMIIEQHGGKIWAESEPGKGTNILFEIPQSHSPDVDD